MKYLKKFNESAESEKIEDIKKFCNEYLAYLIDDGYKVVVYPTSVFPNITIGISYNNRGFMYNDIKDYFIPFITVLKDEFELKYTEGPRSRTILPPIKFIKPDYADIRYTEDAIINDTIEDINLISINITMK